MKPLQIITYRCPACPWISPVEEHVQGHINMGLERRDAAHVKKAKELGQYPTSSETGFSQVVDE